MATAIAPVLSLKEQKETEKSFKRVVSQWFHEPLFAESLWLIRKGMLGVCPEFDKNNNLLEQACICYQAYNYGSELHMKARNANTNIIRDLNNTIRLLKTELDQHKRKAVTTNLE